MYKAYKYRIYPNKEQQERMQQFFGCCRFVYNKYIEWYSIAYKQWKENGINIGKTPLLTEFKREYDFLKECDNAALAYSRSNFERAIKDFIKSKNGKRKGKRLGFPKFKTKHKPKMTYKTCDAHGGIRFVDDSHIKLPKMGLVKCVKHRDFIGTIKAATVECKNSGKYYISLMVECQNDCKPIINKKEHINNLNAVGLDMSLSNFVVSSNNEDNMITKYARLYRKNEKHLQMLQRKLSKKQKGSTNYNKFKRRVSVLHEHIMNQRKDYLEKLSLYYVRKYDIIMLEDINMQEISRSLRLGKSVMDLGFGMFRSMLERKCISYDTSVVYIDKWYPSSKICNSCGHKNSLLRLSDREWVCPKCGVIIDRDYNAACNIRDYVYNIINNTEGTSEIYACGDTASTLRETLLQVVSLKQEAPSFRWV